MKSMLRIIFVFFLYKSNFNRLFFSANFELPDADCLFHEIRYTELDEAQSADILQEYYKEGQLYKSSKDNNRDRYPGKIIVHSSADLSGKNLGVFF